MFMPLRRVLESLLIGFCGGKLVGGINWGVGGWWETCKGNRRNTILTIRVNIIVYYVHIN